MGGSGQIGSSLNLVFCSFSSLLLLFFLLLALLIAVFWEERLIQHLTSVIPKGRREESINQALGLITALGKADSLMFLAFVLGACGWPRRAAQILTGLLVSFLLVGSLKLAVGRERPDGHDRFSFPSADAAAAAAAAVPIIQLFPRTLPLVAVSVLAVATTRTLYLRHYPSDVCAGLALGLIAALVALRFRLHRWIPIRPPYYLAGALIMPFGRYFLGVMGGELGQHFVDFCLVFGPSLVFWVILTHLRPWLRDGAASLRQSLQSRRPRATATLVMAVVILGLFLFTAMRSTLWDRDEPRFARAAVEMVQTGNLLYPTFEGRLRADKPILIYWLMSLSVSVFGECELAFRLVSPLGVAATVLLLSYIGTLLFEPAVGLLSMAIVVRRPLCLHSAALLRQQMLCCWL